MSIVIVIIASTYALEFLIDSYYDQNGDGKLGYEEFKNIIRDIRTSRGLPDDPEAVLQEAAKNARSNKT